MPEDWGLIATLIGLYAAMNAVVIFAVGSLLKQHGRDVGRRLDEMRKQDGNHDQELEDLRQDLADHKLRTERDFVRREDSVIYMSRVERKMDAIWGALHEAITQWTNTK